MSNVVLKYHYKYQFAIFPGIDIGTAELIIQGQVKIKQGIPTAFTRDGITFRDGFSLAADAVIFATGYEPINNSISGIFGVEITKAITPVWGLDAEGELRRAYSPSGHPGVCHPFPPLRWRLRYTTNFPAAVVGDWRFFCISILLKIFGRIHTFTPAL